MQHSRSHDPRDASYVALEDQQVLDSGCEKKTWSRLADSCWIQGERRQDVVWVYRVSNISFISNQSV